MACPFPELIEEIRRALRAELPGAKAQARMMPERRRLEGLALAGRADHEWRRAAVLILIYPGLRGPSLPLTLRRADLNHHAGQISLPGGSLEDGESIEEAALREAREEIGIDPGGIEILGRLSPLRVPPSGFEIDPVVGWTGAPPAFVLERREVAELIELPLALLGDATARGEEEWRITGGPSLVPFWKVDGHKVWGATAMVLAELAELLGGKGETLGEVMENH